MSRQFHIDDLKILAECVRAAKFISDSKSNEIIESLESLCSIYEADELKADVFLVDRVKTTQKGTLSILSTINYAMARLVDGKPHEPQKISFKYLHYTIDDIHSTVDSRKGAMHIIDIGRLTLAHLVELDKSFNVGWFNGFQRCDSMVLLQKFHEMP